MVSGRWMKSTMVPTTVTKEKARNVRGSPRLLAKPRKEADTVK